MSDEELRELALQHANQCIDAWVYEDMGEQAEENGVTFEEWKRVCDLAMNVKVTLPDA